MRGIKLILLTIGLVAIFVAPVSAALKVGDPAPPVTVTDWIKGKPIDVAKEGKGKVVVLEFWATWCGPCIQMIPDTNALYQRYKDKGLILIAITDSSQGQMLKQVQDFVAQQGNAMDYPVAFDKTQRTYASYVVSAGVMGIPHSVVIDKKGNIAWFGHPGVPKMKRVIRDLLLDQYDPSKEERLLALQKKVEPYWNDFNEAARLGDWNKCVSLTKSVLEINPTDFDAIRFTVAIYLEELKSVEDMREWVKSFLETNKNNGEALAMIGSLMLAMPNMTDRQPDLAVQAVQLASKVAPKDAEIMTAVAQVYFQVGDIDSAIKYQKKAVEASNTLDIDSAREALKFFETCKSLHATAKVN